jgi:hypothetical protein
MGGNCTERRRSGIVAAAWLGVVAGPALAGTEQSAVVSSSPAAFDRFGAAVDVSGDLAIVGSPYDDFAGLADAGSATILQRTNGGGWIEAATLTASDAADSDRFGWSVAISGQTAIVGAPLVAGFESVTGAAYVYELGGNGAWAQVARLEVGSFLGRSFFGVSVAIDGDFAVVGAHGGAGEAYVFSRHRNGTNAEFLPCPPVLESDIRVQDGCLDLKGERLALGLRHLRTQIRNHRVVAREYARASLHAIGLATAHV